MGGPGGHPGGELFRGGGHRPADDGDPVPGQTFAPLTLRQAAAALAKGEPLLIPALSVGEAGLAFAGFALYQDGAITLDLGGETATFSKEEVASVRLHLGF